MNIFSNKTPFYVAGPCSVETERQVLETAQRLKATSKIDLLRGGIWKPRTRPGSFEGVGKKGLIWMLKARELTGIPIITEVAKSEHVDLCLKYDFDALWIGARTTVNPFAIQELADALKGVNIPILVKNPVSPDIALWIGAIERFMRAGITNIAAIHRGFTHPGEKIYRNKPFWQIAIDFKSRMPDVPLFCDPSHICGRRDLLQEVAQKAFDLNYQGLMIESHINPNKAWSDAAQQITPEVYGVLINKLIVRNPKENNSDELSLLRNKIDMIDDEIIELIASRMEISREIGTYKKENNITILQSNRWKSIINKYIEQGIKHNLNRQFITSFIKSIHDESIDQQENIFKKDSE
jgi:chorismate mutase